MFDVTLYDAFVHLGGFVDNLDGAVFSLDMDFRKRRELSGFEIASKGLECSFCAFSLLDDFYCLFRGDVHGRCGGSGAVSKESLAVGFCVLSNFLQGGPSCFEGSTG